MMDVGKGKIFPIFHQGRMRDVGRGGNIPHFFHQGRMRDVGRG